VPSWRLPPVDSSCPVSLGHRPLLPPMDSKLVRALVGSLLILTWVFIIAIIVRVAASL
jgi:hypothetical protein